LGVAGLRRRASWRELELAANVASVAPVPTPAVEAPRPAVTREGGIARRTKWDDDV
jgi:hypothetical protein